MAVNRLDLRARLVGFLFFLPILLPVLAGHPFVVFGTGLAALWVIYEACTLLGAGVSLARKGISAIVTAVMAGLFFAIGVMLLRARERVFILLLAATIFSLCYVSIYTEGVLVLLFLAVVISASDIGAYFSGRVIGGPKLAPAFSPSKTWAGSIGGVVSSLLAAEGFVTILFDQHLDVRLGGIVLLLAILSQIGDLYESAMKRRLGIKDSGQIVPGHGGALDRFDGYMTTLPVIAAALALDIAIIGKLPPL
jgi:phosphatidate cytidylyltransferase